MVILKMKPEQREVVSSDGTKIVYQVCKNKGSWVLFLGGISSTYSDWKDISRQFQKAEYSTLALDYRGHGYSDIPKKKTAFEMKWFVEDLIAVIRKEKIDKINIVGHCFGGMVALAFYAKYPERVRSLIVINATYTSPYTRPYLPKFANNFLGWFFKVFYNVLGTVLDFYPLNRLPYKRANIEEFKRVPAWYSLFSVAFLHTHFRTMINGQINMINFNVEKALRKMNKPFLIITNKHDSMMPPERSKEMHSFAKNSELIILSESHKPITHFDSDLKSKIMEFLKRNKL